MNCACGRPLHYSDRDIEAEVTALVERLGEYTVIRVPGVGAWRVQRHYIALHGINAADLPGSRWEKVDDYESRQLN